MHGEVEQFLYLEARLLDTQRYEEWLDLYTEDATYWVLLEQGQSDPVETSSIIYDDRTLLELRVKGALPRMEALKDVVDDHGVNFMATICAICKAQFTKVLPYYGFNMGMVGGVHQLVSKAIRLGDK